MKTFISLTIMVSYLLLLNACDHNEKVTDKGYPRVKDSTYNEQDLKDIESFIADAALNKTAGITFLSQGPETQLYAEVESTNSKLSLSFWKDDDYKNRENYSCSYLYKKEDQQFIKYEINCNKLEQPFTLYRLNKEKMKRM
ncbi:hypothetical protein [Bacillus sp. 1P06AnD]|uniref:hypothetical protein n=1 Tax=Bacillus sp. 1P06AnD TaxID=3132208 RepID=UPI0039A1EEC5